jgi:hypothetical protein
VLLLARGVGYDPNFAHESRISPSFLLNGDCSFHVLFLTPGIVWHARNQLANSFTFSFCRDIYSGLWSLDYLQDYLISMSLF